MRMVLGGTVQKLIWRERTRILSSGCSDRNEDHLIHETYQTPTRKVQK